MTAKDNFHMMMTLLLLAYHPLTLNIKSPITAMKAQDSQPASIL